MSEQDQTSSTPPGADGLEEAAPGRTRRSKRAAGGGRFGVLGWLNILMLGVVIVAAAVMAWMAWNFQGAVSQRQLTESGAIPVVRDFAPGRERADDVLFRIGGDAQVVAGIMPDMVAAWMRTSGYNSVGIDRSGAITEIKGSKDGRNWRVLIGAGSSHGGFEAMLERRVEMVASNRQILPAEADRLSAFGDMLSPSSERVVALDAELVVVNRTNALNAISTDTLARIIAGEITDWSEVVEGGSGPIRVFLMRGGENIPSGHAVSLLGDSEVPEGAQLLDTSSDVAAAVARTAGGIGLVLSSQGSGAAKPLAVSERNAAIFVATPETIATESYPLTVRVSLYVGNLGNEPALKSFADFSLSEAGQMVVGRSDYVDRSISLTRPELPVEAPRPYVTFARSAQRMSFDARFLFGANELDSKAMHDLDMFAEFVRAQGIDNRRVALLGFADNVGARATNIGLAKSRAERVAAYLEQKGVMPGSIQAFGEAMPVGGNSTESGRIRNRRVEVWICDPPACPLVDLATALAPSRTLGAGGIPAGVRLGRPGPVPEGDTPPKG